MSESSMAVSAGALEAKQAQEKAYRKKGLFIALMSGFLYGGYTAFMTQGMATGIWETWYGGAITGFALTYTLSAIGAATNDICWEDWEISSGLSRPSREGYSSQ